MNAMAAIGDKLMKSLDNVAFAGAIIITVCEIANRTEQPFAFHYTPNQMFTD